MRRSKQGVTTLCFKQNYIFLGGLSLHLIHLIPWRLGISFWQFGTLPIGIFLSNLDSRQLMRSPRTLLGLTGSGGILKFSLVRVTFLAELF